ncbi:MAG: GGDEF domain-containing protein [Granulosicoccus sp.]|jgi:hypothetical protein
MSSVWSVQLTCVIFGSRIAEQCELVDALKRSRHIAHADELSRLASLRDHLTRHRYDFVIVILTHPDDNLPACLLRYPELKVLVVTPARKIGPVEGWFQQGATDVVSCQRQDKYRHALERMIEECQLRAQLRVATLKIDSQNKLQQILLNSRSEAVLLWQNGQVIESNCRLDELIGCHHQDRQSRNIEWKRWVSAPCYAELHSVTTAVSSKLVVTNHSGSKYNAVLEQVNLEHGEAKLIRINPQPIGQTSWNSESLDSSTGVLLQQPFSNALDCWLQTTAQKRYTIVQIHVDEPDLLASHGRANSTVQELLSYRVASLLRQEFREGTIIGRTGPTTLTLLPLNLFKNSRGLAARIRSRMGDIGGLLEDTSHIRIKTLTLSTTALCASEIIERLDRPPLLTRRAIRSSPQHIGLLSDSLLGLGA